MFYGLLLKPLPFPEPSRIVAIRNMFNAKPMDSNLVQYTDYKANASSYEEVGLWHLEQRTVGENGAEERMTGASCTVEMFEDSRREAPSGPIFHGEQ